MSEEGSRPARIEDVHELAMEMPHVAIEYASRDRPAYRVGNRFIGRTFVYFSIPRWDVIDPDTRKPYEQLIVFRAVSAAAKQALVQDEASPFLAATYYEDTRWVVLPGKRIGELTRDGLAKLIQDAWLSRASVRRASEWLSVHRPL